MILETLFYVFMVGCILMAIVGLVVARRERLAEVRKRLSGCDHLIRIRTGRCILCGKRSSF